MGRINAAWRVAMSLMGREFTQAEHDAGWPESFKHGQLAALQYPYAKDENTKRRLKQARAGDILNACISGELRHTATTAKVMTQAARDVTPSKFSAKSWDTAYTRCGVAYGYTIPAQYKDVTTYTVTAPAFAAWLDAQPEAPSAHIAAWFEAVGVNTQPEAPPVPTDETIEDRNDRWLAFYESEEKTGRKRGAVQRGANHFNVERSLYGKALKDARASRAEKYRADIKAVPAKGGAGGWGPSTLVEMGKKTKGTKA